MLPAEQAGQPSISAATVSDAPCQAQCSSSHSAPSGGWSRPARSHSVRRARHEPAARARRRRAIRHALRVWFRARSTASPKPSTVAQRVDPVHQSLGHPAPPPFLPGSSGLVYGARPRDRIRAPAKAAPGRRPPGRARRVLAAVRRSRRWRSARGASRCARSSGAFTAFDGTDAHAIVRDLRLPRTELGLLVGAALGAAGALMQGVDAQPARRARHPRDQRRARRSPWSSRSRRSASRRRRPTRGSRCSARRWPRCSSTRSARRAAAARRRCRLALAGAVLASLLTVADQRGARVRRQTLDEFRFWIVGSIAGRDAERRAGGAAVHRGRPGDRARRRRARSTRWRSATTSRARSASRSAARARSPALGFVLLAGGAVAAAGPIAFVGLAVPHVARALVGPDYRWIVPYASLLGAVLLLAARRASGRVVARPPSSASASSPRCSARRSSSGSSAGRRLGGAVTAPRASVRAGRVVGPPRRARSPSPLAVARALRRRPCSCARRVRDRRRSTCSPRSSARATGRPTSSSLDLRLPRALDRPARRARRSASPARSSRTSRATRSSRRTSSASPAARRWRRSR